MEYQKLSGLVSDRLAFDPDGPSPHPTSRQLAEKRALEAVLRPNYKFSDFEELDPRLQQNSFEAIRTEI